MSSNSIQEADNLNRDPESIEINSTEHDDNDILLSNNNIDTDNNKINNENNNNEDNKDNNNNLKLDNSLTYETEKTKLNERKKPKKINNTFKSYLLYGNHIDNLKPSHLGKTKVLFYYHNYPLIILGPDYCYNIWLSIPSIIIFLIIYIFLFKYNFITIKIVETIIFLFYICSYLFTALINPGIPNREYFSKTFIKNNVGGTKKIQKCKKCNIIVPKNLNVSHCDYCEVCVIGQDHHCPWTGKCVGKNNLITFYCFIFSLILFIIWSFVTLLTFIICYEEENDKRRRQRK